MQFAEALESHPPIHYGSVPLLIDEVQDGVAHVLLYHIEYKLFEFSDLKYDKKDRQSRWGSLYGDVRAGEGKHMEEQRTLF